MNNILKGQLFIVDEFETLKESSLEKEFDKIEFYETYDLSKGSVTTEGEIKSLRFDIDLGKEFKGSCFIGSLNVDHTITGKIQYSSDTHTSESLISGEYIITNKNAIIIAGVWQYPDEVKEYFWIELK